MPIYNKISDMTSVANQVRDAASQADKIESILTVFLNDLVKQYGATNKAVNYYNSIQCLLDGIADKTVYEGVLAQHSRVLRTFCHKLRTSIAMTDHQISALVAPNFSFTPPPNATKLIGIRKSIRVTTNMGIITPWLVDDEPEAAALSMCSWAVVSPNIIIDSGFLVAYGNKFDALNSGCLTKVDAATINDPNSLTPKEFAIICKHLIEHLVKTHGKNNTVDFLDTVFKAALDRYTKRTGDNDFRILAEYAEKFCGINTF